LNISGDDIWYGMFAAKTRKKMSDIIMETSTFGTYHQNKAAPFLARLYGLLATLIH
jgi:hypothetical protein